MAIKNFHTEVSEDKTVGEIMGLLSSKGARSIRIDYDDQGRPSGVSFIVFVDALPIPFKLPCNFEGVLKAMTTEYKQPGAQRRFKNSPESMSQARRIAWRIVKNWIEAQMALIEAEQASLIQVFLPYAITNQQTGATAFSQFMDSVDKQKALPAAPVEVD